MAFRVSEVARIANVTVRMLHHYEQVGLLVPSRSESSYRLYGQDDLLRLQQILLWREMGFSLEQIRRILDEPDFDLRSALAAQRRELSRRVGRTEAMIRSVDAALQALETSKGERDMDPTKLFEGFDPGLYEAEVREKWGEGEAYREAARRTKRYAAKDWTRMKSELESLYEKLAEKMREGAAPTDPDVAELAEAHRLHIDRWFYPCSPGMHCGLGEMYVADERFTAAIDEHAPGLARYLADAIRASSSRS
jgi:DNA-binding transcriptional MerR regulator